MPIPMRHQGGGALRPKTTAASTSSTRKSPSTAVSSTPKAASSRSSARQQQQHQPPRRRQQATWTGNAHDYNKTPGAGGGSRTWFWWWSHQWRDSLKQILSQPRTVPIPRWITPRHSTMTLSEVLGHSSFVLVAVSYAVDDFLLLRCIAVAGSTAMLFFTYFHPHGRPLWLPFQWNALFIAINSYRIGKVLLNRYYADQLSPEFLELRDKTFYLMDKVDFSRLVRSAKVEEYKKGQVVIMQGQHNRHVKLILKNGKFRVLRDGKFNYFLEEANFISECGLHAGLMLPGKIESCCTIVAEHDGTRVLTWDRTALIELMERHAGLRRAMKTVLTWDLVRKLKTQRTLLTEGYIVDDSPAAWSERRHEQTLHRYTAILQNLLSHAPPKSRLLDEYRMQLKKYRMIHHIDDAYHEKALQKLGWTLEEFESNQKHTHPHHPEDVDDNEDLEGRWDDSYFRRDLRWYLHDLYCRLFGL